MNPNLNMLLQSSNTTDAFDYHHHNDEGDSLEHFGSYASPAQLTNDSATSPLRPDGYGMLGQPMLHSMSLPANAKGLHYSSNPDILDLPPFQSGSGTPISPFDSSCGSTSTSPGSASSSFALSSHATYSSTNGSIGSFSSAAPVGCPPPLNFMQAYMPLKYEHVRPITSPPYSGMPPPSRSPRDPSSVSPSLGTSGRQTYTTSAPHASRYPYQPQGNPNYLPNPTVPSSFGSSISTTASSGYNSSNPPMHYDASAHMLSSQSVPPFDKTKTIYSIYNGKGIEVRAELHAKIDKGFFKADQDWTCYRRNYFSVACWYTLQPPLDPSSEPLFLRRAGASSHEAIHNFAVCITARVNGEDGKVIDLVQHTPKRDKGPTGQPEKQKLLPQGPGSVGIYPDSSGNLSPGSQLSPDYEGYSTPGQQQNSRLATFDRIQFKNATANNGKRRAAQQYFHLVVELFAEIQSGQSSSEGQWIKIATRMSAPMVVRGRSPGHYSDDRRSSSTSMGPGGGSSGDSTGARDPSSTGPSGSRSGGSGIASFSGSSRGGSGGYLSHQATVHHSSSEGSSNHSSAASNYATATGTSHGRLPEPVLTSEEANNIEEFEGYQYYPSPLYEAPSHGSHGVRQRLPFMRANTTFKLEPHSSPGHHPHFSQVSTSPEDYALPRNFFKTEPDASPNNNVSCGRFQGVSSSRGYYPETPAI